MTRISLAIPDQLAAAVQRIAAARGIAEDIVLAEALARRSASWRRWVSCRTSRRWAGRTGEQGRGSWSWRERPS